MIRILRRHAISLIVVLNVMAMLSMLEAIRTSIYVSEGRTVPRNPFALTLALAEPPYETPPSSLQEYRITEMEKRFQEIREDVKELRNDFTHITEMLIGALLAVVINLAITIVSARRRRDTTGGISA